MDPLSIVSSIAGIAAVSLQAARRLEALRSKFQNAHVTITALSSQCRTIKTGLAELQKLVVQNRTIRDRMDVIATLDATLTGCMVVLSCLDCTVDKLHAGTADSRRSSLISRWRNKASIVWNEAEMKGYLFMLQGQQSAVAFLVQLLQMESIDEILERVKRSKDFLDKQATDAASLRQANPELHLADSVLATKRGANTIFGDAGSVIGDQEFDFDNIVVNSKAYRRAMMMAEAAVSSRSVTTQRSVTESQSSGTLISPPRTSSISSQKTVLADNIMSPESGSELTKMDSGVGVPSTAIDLLPDEEEELRRLLDSERKQHEGAKAQLAELQFRLQNSRWPTAGSFLAIYSADYIEHKSEHLYQSIRDWVAFFSMACGTRTALPMSQIDDEKIIDRLDNTTLDDSDVEVVLRDYHQRQNPITSLVSAMIWEFMFTRYLFGLDREQRQKLKGMERMFSHAPSDIVREWRATTLALIVSRSVFQEQRDTDAEAVAQEIFRVVVTVLPLSVKHEGVVLERLREVVNEAVELSIMMRTQQVEYMMLPPLQPEYDARGELTNPVTFNATLMNECSGRGSLSADELEKQGAKVRCVLFPLVVRKGDDRGVGDDEIVVYPAQVLVQDAAFTSNV